MSQLNREQLRAPEPDQPGVRADSSRAMQRSGHEALITERGPEAGQEGGRRRLSCQSMGQHQVAHAQEGTWAHAWASSHEALVAGRGAETGQEGGKGGPVVEHDVAHAQEGELLKTARPRTPSHRALRNAVEGVVVVPLEGVLPCQLHPLGNAALDDLLQEACKVHHP